MSKSRLTRQELSWLLTQEAQNAAERLRHGVQTLRTTSVAPPPLEHAPPSDHGVKIDVLAEAHDPARHVDASLDELDDVMRMLSNLNQRAAVGLTPPRRGRIDVAALLVELAPEARVQIEPGSGTEVFGEEADLRRMLQVLVGHGSGLGSNVVVRRDGEDVRVSVSLGPDASPTAETERVWLSRMALRYGGRHELEGGNEVLVFPAEEAAEASEREKLRKELDEARKQGEAYARELAAIFERGDDVAHISTMPPPVGVSPEAQFAALAKLARGLATELRDTLGPLSRELGAVRRHELTDEQVDTLRRRVAHAHELVSGVATFGEVSTQSLATEVDLAEVVRSVVRDLGPVVDRHEVRITVADGERVHVRAAGKAIGAVVRGLLEHAVRATPPGGAVAVTVDRNESGGARLQVDDDGPPLPSTGRRTFLALETDAGAYGRPSALPLFLAAELTAALGSRLDLGDAPAGGLRVTATFPKL